MFEYRVLRRNDEVGVFEVYLDDSGLPNAATINPMSPMVGTVDGLRHELEQMLRALERPVLDYDSLGDDGSNRP